MFLSKSKLLTLVAIATSVLGHGQVRYFVTSTTTYPAADAYAAPNPNSPIRKLDTYGPAAPFTSTAITCGSGGNNPAGVVAPVAAGSTVTFDWGSWSSSHQGPVMTYIAACPNGCATFKGETGNVWVKIQHDGYVGTRSPPWAEEIIRATGKWSLTIPSTLPDGEYILRHEILGLHVAYQANGAQFYPNCVQIRVTGGGNVPLPSGIALPGAYQPDHPGILVQLYTITPSNPSYTIPGGPILYGNGAVASTPAPGSTSSTRRSSSTSSTSSTRVSSSSSTRASSTSSAAGPGQTLYGQCGGQGWNGPTTCAAGTCTYSNAWYSQCLP